MPRMRDITGALIRKLERIPPPRDPTPWCRCDGSWLGSVMAGADEILGGRRPDTTCVKCGRPLHLIIVLSAGGDAGRAQLALLNEMESQNAT